MQDHHQKNHEWIEYFASIEVIDGEIESGVRVIIDAIPRGVITELKALSPEQAVEHFEKTFAFLLLTTKFSPELAALLVNTKNWASLSLTHIDPRDENAIEAQSVDFSNDEDGTGQTFWIKVEHKEVPKRELSVLVSLAEVAFLADCDTLDCLGEPHSIDEYGGIAVYDVGQANLCAVVDMNEHPILFFDLGWPLPFNKRSARPHGPFDPFILDAPDTKTPIVLSHLDWDHWGFAYKSGQARYDNKRGFWKSEVSYHDEIMSRPWLMRRPRFHRHKLGPSHIHLVLTLSQTPLEDLTPALKIWPAKRSRMDWGACTIIRCSPEPGTITTPAFLRNNESLALMAASTSSQYKVLLCGDADYPSIGASYKRSLTGIVAPHHGGSVTPWSIPPASGVGQMVMSTYPGCYSNVPSVNTETEARDKGWEIRKTCNRRHCHGSCDNNGNQLIELGPYQPECGCGQVPRGGLCLSL